ncbi:hypothetical protein PG996_015979 [Apiospora saccharicola]|uniref:Uncharacterized protein n=1 Tax=Apiospora saccharicola TaxID=335842 RepID=A0ABR1TPU9_9PEZI
MDYGRRYDDGPPRHHHVPRTNRARGAAVETTYVRDGGKEYQHVHKRHASDGQRTTYREEHYALPLPPARDAQYYYEEEIERRRRPAHGRRQPSYSVEAVPRGRHISSSTTKSDELVRHHHRAQSHHVHEKKRTSKSKSKSGTKDSLGGLDLNWKQAAEAAAGAAAAEMWRSRGNPDQIKRVATAAAGAVAVDLALGRGSRDDKNKRHAMESAIGGLVIDRMVNGSSSKR